MRCTEATEVWCHLSAYSILQIIRLSQQEDLSQVVHTVPLHDCRWFHAHCGAQVSRDLQHVWMRR